MKFLSNHFVLTLLASSVLAGCAQTPAPSLSEIVADSDSTVVAQGEIVGQAAAYDDEMMVSDCAGGGLDVKVSGLQGDTDYLYDKTGNLCKGSQILFDGLSKAGQRAPDPTVAHIRFADEVDYTTPEAPMPDITVVDVPNGHLPENMALTAPQKNQPQEEQVLEGFERTVKKWQADSEHAELVKDAELLLSGVRDLDRMNRNQVLKKHQEYIVDLESRLREMEKENDFLKDHGNRLVVDLNEKTNVALMDQKDQIRREQAMQKEMSLLEKKAYMAEQANQRILEKFGEDVVVYRERIDDLSQQLRAAEQQADKSRQTMVIEAAKKIAEAEYLAQEAQLAKRLTMQRRAQRLQLEAGDLLAQARKIGDGHPIVLPKFSGLEKMPAFDVVMGNHDTQEAALVAVPYPDINEAEGGADQRLNIEDVTVHLNEKNTPLAEVFEVAFDDMAERIGYWQVVWQVKPENEHLKHAEWTVVAEAPLSQFLAYVSEKIEKEKGVYLNFQRFDQSRLFMITDAK